jgi:hypothetical protein
MVLHSAVSVQMGAKRTATVLVETGYPIIPATLNQP